MGAILCFHSITTDRTPGAGSAHVSLERFAALVRAVRRVGTLVPLSELAGRRASRQSTTGLVSITFDDAYAALQGDVRELITRENIPVSVFVVTNAAANGRPYWWDRIDDLFPHVSPARWKAFEDACGLPDEYRRGQPQEYGPLRPLRQWLLATFAGRWPEQLEGPLVALEQETHVRTVQRSMTFDEIGALAALPCVEIGVHTVSHPVLPLLRDEELAREIADCYAALRERFINVLPVLAVPFGLYDERTLRIARKVGMTASMTLAGRRLEAGGSDNGWPRFCVTKIDRPVRVAAQLLGVPEVVRRFWPRDSPLYPALPSATT